MKKFCSINLDHYPLSLLCLTALITLTLTLPTIVFAESIDGELSPPPNLVPDRPGYADATSSVDRGHWHAELGGSWLPNQDATANALFRYGLGRGWELRLMSPTLFQVFPYEIEGGETRSPDLALGGAQLGAKWAHHWPRLEFSSSLMIGIPTNGTSVAMNPDALASLTTQMSHGLNSHLSAGLVFKYAILDGLARGQEVAYAKELGHLMGLVGSLSWGEVDWSIFTQAGVEVLDELVTPLVGAGLTLRVSEGSQVDLSLDAPLAADGVSARYMAGITLSW